MNWLITLTQDEVTIILLSIAAVFVIVLMAANYMEFERDKRMYEKKIERLIRTNERLLEEIYNEERKGRNYGK